MIGFYNYSVIVTYLGVISSMIGISLACNGIFDGAILCLALAGACDTFDGKIARAMKNRTHEMEIFGVQIDSLCDMVCFGVTPAVICYQMGLKSVAGICCEIFFVLCGVIRLAYFNMLEELKHSKPASADEKKYYHGLPITSITIIFPVVYIFRTLLDGHFTILLAVMLLFVGFFYILDFRLKKPGNAVVAAIMAFVALVMLNIFFFHLFWKGFALWITLI